MKEKIEEWKLIWDQSLTQETAWKYNIDEMDVAEADDINMEQAIQAGEVKDWYDADTHAYLGTW